MNSRFSTAAHIDFEPQKTEDVVGGRSVEGKNASIQTWRRRFATGAWHGAVLIDEISNGAAISPEREPASVVPGADKDCTCKDCRNKENSRSIKLGIIRTSLAHSCMVGTGLS